MEMFDQEGDRLIRSIDDSQMQVSLSRGKLLSKEELICHPKFLHATYLVTAISTKGGKIPFEGTPTQFTTDVNKEDTIVFEEIKRMDNYKLMDRAVILTRNIINIQPTDNDWTKFEHNDPSKLTFESENLELSVDLFESSEQVFEDIDQASFQGESYQDLIHSYQIPNRQTPSPTQSQLQTDFEAIPFLKTSTMNKFEKQLPILASGKVDLFMLNELYKLENDQTVTFAQWRKQKGFDMRIQQENLQFGVPIAFENAPEKQKQNLEKWQTTFASHQLGFDDWTLLNSITPFEFRTIEKNQGPKQKLCETCGYCTCTGDDKCTCCGCIDAQAERLLVKANLLPKIEEREEFSRANSTESLSQTTPTPGPSQQLGEESMDVNQAAPITYDPWKLVYPTFMQKMHDEHCQEWFQKNNKTPEAEEVMKQWQKQGGWAGTGRSFYQFLSEMQPWTPIPQESTESIDQSAITKPNPDTLVCSQKEIAILYDTANQSCSRMFKYIRVSPTDFLPGGSLSTVYIPTYCYIPDACLVHFRLQVHKLSTFSRLILWQKLYHARQQAQLLITQDHLKDIPINDWTKHLMSVMTKDSISHTHLIDLIQHSEAVKMNKAFDLTPIAVYDTLIRPMERLCGIEMPLHDVLAKARFDMKSRNELHAKLIALTNLDLKMTLNSHSLFKYISFIRHLSYENLSPSHRFGVGPMYHIQSLDPFEDDPSEKPLPPATVAKLQRKIMHQLCVESPVADPYVQIPLEPGYLREFPELGGVNMSIMKQKLLVNIHNDVVENEPKVNTTWHQQQQQKQKLDKPLMVMCEFIADERKASQQNEFYDSDPSPRSYSETIKLRPQVIQAPPVPIRPQPTAELQVFPFFKKS